MGVLHWSDGFPQLGQERAAVGLVKYGSFSGINLFPFYGVGSIRLLAIKSRVFFG
jgi:hypothetical protein